MTKSQMMRNSNLTVATYRGKRDKTNLMCHQSYAVIFFRIFFLHPEGDLLKDITNKEGNPKFKYYYYSTGSILDSMEEVLLDFYYQFNYIEIFI